MRLSGRSKRFMDHTDDQVTNNRTKKNSLFLYLLKFWQKAPLRRKPLHIAPTPFQFLPDNVEERNVRQRGQWQGLLCLSNVDSRPSLHPDWLAAVQGQKNRIIWVAHFNLDDRCFCHDNRAVREDVRTNRRNNEDPRFRIENWSAGCKRICGRARRW